MSRAYLVPAIKRAFQVIDLLARSGNGLTISDIHRSLKLPLSSAATILYTLQELGYLERDEPTGRYTLGVRMMSFSGRVADQFNLVGRCRPLLEELVRKSGLTGHLAVRRKGESMYVARVPGPGLLQFSSYVGMHWPVHASAAGKALLAFLRVQQASFAADAEAAKAFAPSNRPASLSEADAAAWCAVARVLLNTDEFITRE